MYAIVEIGGKQYKVQKNDILKIEKIDQSTDEFSIDKIMLVSEDGRDITIGAPFVKDFIVKAKILETRKDKKVLIFKKKRRQNYRRKLGHRQMISVIKILDITNKKTKQSSATDKLSQKDKPNEKKEPKEKLLNKEKENGS